MSKYAQTNLPCPRCGSSDSMATFHDHGGMCFSGCGFIKQHEIDGSPAPTQTKTRRASMYELSDVREYPLADLSHRGIKKDTVEKYQVRQAMRQQDGEADDKAIFFPAGVTQGFKRKNAQNKRDMEILGEYKGLFGQHIFPQGGKFAIITEGEEDAMCVWQAYHERGKNYTVLSLPNGSGAGGIEKKEVWDYLCSFEGVLLLFDNDEPGREAEEKFADLYATETHIKIGHWPSDINDANDAIQKGRQGDIYQTVSRATEYQPEMVVPGSEITLDMVSTPIKPGYHIKRFPDFSRAIGGIRDGELTTVLAPSGVGKSTWAAEIGYELIKHTNEKVAWLFLEENLKKATQRLIALDNNTPLPLYRLNPDRIGQENIRKSYDALINNNRTWFIDLGNSGRINLDRLLHLLRYYASQGVTRIIFDHISIVFSHDERNDERKLIDNVLSEIAAFCAATGVHLIMVAHIKRMNNKMYIKDEANDASWLIIDPDSARGSGTFEQLSFNLVAIEPEYMEDGTRGRSRLNVKKSREWGIVGPQDIIRMDPKTGRMESMNVQYDF